MSAATCLRPLATITLAMNLRRDCLVGIRSIPWAMRKSRPRSSPSAPRSSRASDRSPSRTASLLLRSVDRDLLDVFKARAERNGRSLQAELQLSLRREAHRNFDEALKISEHWHAALRARRTPVPAARDLIAKDRRR